MKPNVETKSRKQKGLELKKEKNNEMFEMQIVYTFFKGLKVILLLPFALPLFGQCKTS
jgi:hypothetical protein